ncbi:1,4-alpha-glucan (glycogen) branching enzyme, GH-13-type [Enhygromyxa salina]|uniref:1,4-alpha-glucan branching enzyme GlgB n=1 Tax=Enhygromyxa salina TaxID=215803 RepID=A0A0C2DAP2_9BACT|nr:1,4-alpha-glucan branching protein GlgB [Enhygromyxa salina]KIG18585.1 1,4-alpha-glucan (glycogen) branching enzyme, GH-13-type [Enhygromyxa salina]
MLTQAEITALVRAEHDDPFAVLGPHLSDAGLWVRALLPGATSIELLDTDGSVVAPLASIHPDGLFELLLDTNPPALGWAYQLQVHYPHGHTERIDDPYRFGSTLGELDRHLLGEGSHLRPWQVLGAHAREQQGVAGVRFVVWAPNAARVAVIGDFNQWEPRRHPMRLHPSNGVWELFIPGVGVGAKYKYELRTRDGRVLPGKADPYAFASELRPASASVVAPFPRAKPLSEPRRLANTPTAPVSIYEVHLGSWRRGADNSFPTWDTLAEQLPAYVAKLGFTHIELLPIAEHPFDGSWGYQVTGMFAPTSRFGDPAGLATLIEACHAHGLGVILDWVPAHFPNDAYSLVHFDGTALYEYADPREGVHKDWDTLIYNFGRTEVRNFLVGSALYWLECWGIDGLRVDAVASMLYRDYSREPGEWVPNVHGGRENLEAISLVRRVNEVVRAEAPGCVTVAEESTSWPGVSRPTETGGLGFDYKWNLGWMHDTLGYFANDPLYRKHHHDKLTFSIMYAFDERFVLPLSHDEVVHGKRSLINKMPGDRWQMFANLRALFAYMWTHPGKKLLFMGGEFAQQREWNHDRALDWELLDPSTQGSAEHRGVQALITDLNRLYRARPALHELDCAPEGFEWVIVDDQARSVLVFVRKDSAGGCVMVACNFTPVPRPGYRIGVAMPGNWRVSLSTDALRYAGSDYPCTGNKPGAKPRPITAKPIAAHGHEQSITLNLPPLATVILEPNT